MLELSKPFEERLNWSWEISNEVLQEIAEKLDRKIKGIMLLEEDNDLDYGEIFNIITQEDHVWHEVKNDYPYVKHAPVHVLSIQEMSEEDLKQASDLRKKDALQFNAQAIEMKLRLYNMAKEAEKVFLKKERKS